MQDFNDFNEKMIKLKIRLQNDRPRIALAVSLNLNARVQLRLQEDGLNASGFQFSPYAPQSVNQRKGKGYQTAFVDFTQTGAMMSNIQPRVESNTETGTSIRIAPNRQKEIAKYKGNDKIRRGFYHPSVSEIKAAVSEYSAEAIRLIKIGI